MNYIKTLVALFLMLLSFNTCALVFVDISGMKYGWKWKLFAPPSMNPQRAR